MGCAESKADELQAAVQANSMDRARTVLRAAGSPEQQAAILRVPADDSTLDTPLHVAARRGQFGVLATVLDAVHPQRDSKEHLALDPAIAAALETRNALGHTPLHTAAFSRRGRWAECIHALLSAGCDPTAPACGAKTAADGRRGDTTLHTLVRVVTENAFDASRTYPGGNLSHSGSRRGSGLGSHQGSRRGSSRGSTA